MLLHNLLFHNFYPAKQYNYEILGMFCFIIFTNEMMSVLRLESRSTTLGYPGYLPIMTVNARDKAGTSRDKQGQVGISRDQQGQTETVPFCPCLSLPVPVCPCVSLSVPVCPCLSLHFLYLHFSPCRCISQSV